MVTQNSLQVQIDVYACRLKSLGLFVACFECYTLFSFKSL